MENMSSEETNDLENRALSLIRKAELKKLPKRKIIQFLKRKGVPEKDLIEAYQQYYQEEKMYEIMFTERPLGFSVITDTRGKNAIVSSIQSVENNKKGMKIASRMYEINGQRVDGLKHKEILNIIGSVTCPFYIVFKEPNDGKRGHKKSQESAWVESAEDTESEESGSDSTGDSSYSSDDDVRHVEQYNKRKQQDPQNRKKRVSKSKSKSKGVFKFEEIEMWDEGDLDSEKNEMFKELAKLMVTAAVSNVAPTNDPTLQAMSEPRKATLSKLVDHTPKGGDNKMMTFDLSELSKDEEEDSAQYDPDILRYLQDLMGSDDKNLSRSGSLVSNNMWTQEDLMHEESNSSQYSLTNTAHANNESSDVLPQMIEGTTLLKRGRYCSSGYRTFRLSKDHKYLVWFSQKKNVSNTKIPIKEIVEIGIGKESDAVRKTTDQEIHETSFTVIYGNDRKQLNVTAKSPQEAYVWAQGLKILSDAAKRGADLSSFKSLDVNKMTHERSNSVLISMGHSKSQSLINVFQKNNDNAAVQKLMKRQMQLKRQLKKCIDFVLNKNNYRAIKSKGEFSNVKQKLEKIDTNLRNVKDLLCSENNEKDVSRCKAELFSVAADLDALKQMLTALVRKQKEL